MTPRSCPACGTEFEALTARRRWCRPACRQYVHAAGGPAALAQSLRQQARIVRAVDGVRAALAADFDQRAAALEALEAPDIPDGVTTRVAQ